MKSFNLLSEIVLALIAAFLMFPTLPIEAQVDPYQGEAIPAEAVTELSEAREQRRAGEYDTAIKRFRVLVEQQPEYYLAWYNLGLAQANTSDLDAAVEALQRALDLKESLDLPDSTIYNSLGWSHYLRGDYLPAKRLLEQALEQEELSDRSRIKALNNLGSVLLRLQDYERAEEYFRKAIDLGSTRAEVNLRVLKAARSMQMKQKSAQREKGSGGG